MTLERMKRWQKIVLCILCVTPLTVLANYMLQRFWAHRDDYFVPDYPRVELTEDSDYDTIFLQTGLGRPAVDKLLADGNFQAILDAQDLFFNPPKGECTALLGWFTREDMLETPGPFLADIQPGDILITLSTHTIGWRHGHAGIAVEPDTTLECAVWGADSACFPAQEWTDYTNYAVLRLKDSPPETGQKVADYGLSTLLGVPYHLTSGFIGPKAPDPEAWQFGLHCSYLVWYAYQHFGYDLDSDGGRLVSSYDLLHSDLVEVVQIYGMDPRQFLKEEG